MPKKDPYQILEEHPEWANWTYEDFTAELCRLEAQEQDREQRRATFYRECGFFAPYDAQVIVSAERHFPHGGAPLWKVMEMFRLKRGRRGHKQQEALDLWNAHYAKGERVMADAKTIDKIEAMFEEQEKRLEAERKNIKEAEEQRILEQLERQMREISET
jgi:hypothetical protein